MGGYDREPESEYEGHIRVALGKALRGTTSGLNGMILVPAGLTAALQSLVLSLALPTYWVLKGFSILNSRSLDGQRV